MPITEHDIFHGMLIRKGSKAIILTKSMHFTNWILQHLRVMPIMLLNKYIIFPARMPRSQRQKSAIIEDVALFPEFLGAKMYNQHEKLSKGRIIALQWRHMTTMASQITVNPTNCPTVSSGAHQREYQRSASLALRGESTGDWWIHLTKGH